MYYQPLIKNLNPAGIAGIYTYNPSIWEGWGKKKKKDDEFAASLCYTAPLCLKKRNLNSNTIAPPIISMYNLFLVYISHQKKYDQKVLAYSQQGYLE